LNRLVRFGPAARAELTEAVAWYDKQAPALGGRLTAEIDACVARIAANPLRFPIAMNDVRRAPVRHFPYSLFFRFDDAHVFVIACFHARRDPAAWQARS
jgi:plasmid stabilization system protein ParE